MSSTNQPPSGPKAKIFPSLNDIPQVQQASPQLDGQSSIHSDSSQPASSVADEDILRATEQHGKKSPKQHEEAAKAEDDSSSDTASDGDDDEEEDEDEDQEESKKGEPKNELNRLLKEHRMTEYFQRLTFNKLRNQREVLTLAHIVDRMLNASMDDPAVKILVSRLQAVRLADYSKSWEVAQHLERVPLPGTELVPDAKLKKALKRSQLYKKALAPKSKDYRNNSSDDEEHSTPEQPKARYRPRPK
jgi:hypothetical protein